MKTSTFLVAAVITLSAPAWADEIVLERWQPAQDYAARAARAPEEPLLDRVAAVKASARAIPNTQTVLVNGYVDLASNSRVTPYVFGGVGVAVNDSRRGARTDDNLTSDYSDLKTNLAWNAGTGMNYALDDHWGLDLAYRYLNMGPATLSAPTTTGELTSHELVSGLKYKF
jgi:opacity protein-like surface antigen